MVRTVHSTNWVGIFLIISLLIFLFVGWALFKFGYVTYRDICDKTVGNIPFDKMREPLYSKYCLGVSSEKIFDESRIIDPPNAVADWCVVQKLSVKESLDYMQSSEIIGYDTIEECCLKKMIGYDPCLDRISTQRMCFTGNAGGAISYYTIDGVIVDYKYKDKYRTFMGNLHKEPGIKSCVGKEYYPSKVLEGDA